MFQMPDHGGFVGRRAKGHSAVTREFTGVTTEASDAHVSSYCELISSSRGLPCLELWRAVKDALQGTVTYTYDVLRLVTRLSSYVELASHVVQLPRRLNAWTGPASEQLPRRYWGI